jgi:hypothetical protein
VKNLFIPAFWKREAGSGTTARIGWHAPLVSRRYERMPASVWIRCLQIIPYLAKSDISSTLNKPRRWADVAIFLRWQNGEAAALARKLKAGGQKIVFDLCVNYFDTAGIFDGGYGSTDRQRDECLAMVEIADAVTCSSAYIRDRAAEHHDRAVYLPDSVDRGHFSSVKKPSDFSRIRLRAAWSGQSIKARELAAICPLLRERDMDLLLITDRRPDLPGPADFVPWTYETFPTALVRGDFCLSPRSTDNPYDLGHSHFKIGVFMAAGVPALASPTPSYREVIEKTGGGRICETPESWAAALDEIASNHDLLRTWSTAARRGMEPYTTAAVAEQYAALFRDLLKKP